MFCYLCREATGVTAKFAMDSTLAQKHERRPKPPCTWLVRVVSYQPVRKQKVYVRKVA